MQVQRWSSVRLSLYLLLGLVFLVVAASLAGQQATNPRRSDHSSVLPSGSSERSGEASDVLADARRLNTSFGSLPVRTIDGSENNQAHPDWGSAGTTLLRRTLADYSDGIDTPAAPARLSARAISNLCSAQRRSVSSPDGVTSFVWQWGQFLDHDIDLVPVTDPPEVLNISVPSGDRFFDPDGTGGVSISFERSHYRRVAGVREQVNSITAFIDASNVYGSDAERARALRALDGSGRLATSVGDLLPFNTGRLDNAPTGDDPTFFLAGDFRANEQVGLLAMHTLFMREHNFWALRFRDEDPTLNGDESYELARMIVAAEMQAITYREFLPVLLGPNALSAYDGYEPSVNPGISNEFATAAYRFGHSMLPPRLLRIDADGNEIPPGHLALARAFFAPIEIRTAGIAPLLRGLARQRAESVDTMVVNEVRNFLFGGPRSGGFDLAALNIQRGRDHGIPSYNRVRADFGLAPARSFAEINGDRQIQSRLQEAYEAVDDIDAWVGGLAEPAVGGGLVGETWRAVLVDQFERLRTGDRFWYQSSLPPELVALVESQTLATIIRRNTEIGNEIPDNVFRAGVGGAR